MVVRVLISLVTILGYVILNVRGGRPSGRIYKRFLAPSWLILGLVILNPWSLTASPIWFLESQIPRGKDTIWDKILWRSVWGLSFGLGAVILSTLNHYLIAGIAQLVLCLAGSLFFGIVNPFARFGEKGAVITEGSIALLSTIILPFLS